MKTKSLPKVLSGAIMIALLSTSSSVFAQVKVGDNPASINSSSVLDVESTNKGMLPPRLNIPDLNQASPVTSPATGLVAYNTNTTSGIGLVYWDGTKWGRLTATSNNFTFSTYAAGSIKLGTPGQSYTPIVLPGSGGISSAVLSATPGTVQSLVQINFDKTLPSTDYIVLTSFRITSDAVPPGSGATDQNDLIAPQVRNKTANSFQVYLERTSSGFGYETPNLVIDVIVLLKN